MVQVLMAMEFSSLKEQNMKEFAKKIIKQILE